MTSPRFKWLLTAIVRSGKRGRMNIYVARKFRACTHGYSPCIPNCASKVNYWNWCWGLGLLDWRAPVGGHIRRHLVTAQVELVFEPGKGVMRLEPPGDGARLRLEDDMLEAELRPDRGQYQAVQMQLDHYTSEISQAVSNLSVVEALYGFLASLASLVSVYGLWAMKKWGVYLLLLVVLLGVFITYVISPPWVVQSPLGWWVPFILPAIYLAVVLPYWGRLSGAAANDDAQV